MIEKEASETVEAPEQEIATIPLSMVGSSPVKEGDVVRLKVVSVDSDNGSFDVVYAHDKPVGGIKKMASAFDAPMPEQEPM